MFQPIRRYNSHHNLFLKWVHVDFNFTHICFVFHLDFLMLGQLFCIVASYTFLFNGFNSVFHSNTGVCYSVTVLT